MAAPHSQQLKESGRECCIKTTCEKLRLKRSLTKSTNTEAPDESCQIFPNTPEINATTECPYCIQCDTASCVVCPHCGQTINVLQTGSPDQDPSSGQVKKVAYSGVAAVSLPSGHLDTCAANMCIHTSAASAVTKKKRREEMQTHFLSTCSQCGYHRQFPVGQQKNKFNCTSSYPTTCPHLQFIYPASTSKSSDHTQTPSQSELCSDPVSTDYIKTVNMSQMCSCGRENYQPISRRACSDRSNSLRNRVKSICTAGSSFKPTCTCLQSKKLKKFTKHGKSKVKEDTSTMILYMEPDFVQKSKSDLFFDCPSASIAGKGQSALENAETFLCVLRKLTQTAKQLLDHFENAMGTREQAKEKRDNTEQRFQFKMKQKSSSGKTQFSSNGTQIVGEPIKILLPLQFKVHTRSNNPPQQRENFM